MYIRMYVCRYVCMYSCMCACICACMYIFLCVYVYVCVCLWMYACTYVCLYYMRVYSMCICTYSGKEGIFIRCPSLGDDLAAILQGWDELYLLAQETCCDLSPYWCSGLRPVYSHLRVFSRNQSFIGKQIFFNHAVIISFKAIQYTTFELALF